MRPTGITVTRALRDGDDVSVGGTAVRVFAVPSHTAGSAAYLIRDVLVIGDSADTASDGSLTPAVWIFSDSQDVDRASLVSLSHRLADEAVTIQAIEFAHSGVLIDGLNPLTTFARTNQ